MKQKKVYSLVLGAVIAALYAALTYVAASVGLAYGPVQFRFSEALTVLAALTPAAIPGLTIGCFLGNLGSNMPIDIICGTFATFVAAVLSYATRKVKFKGIPVLAPLFPIIANAIIVGAEITIYFPDDSIDNKAIMFLLNALWVGLGELVVCYGAGIPLLIAIEKTPLKKYLK